MATRKTDSQPFDVIAGFLAAHDTNDRINHYLIEHLPLEAWHADPPTGKGRTVAAQFAHIHNVRLMWLKAAGYSGEMPVKLEGDAVSPTQAADALRASGAALRTVLAESLAAGGKIKGFKPDVASFMAYLFAHDVHHRGQISMQARHTGHKLPQSAMFGLWEWGTR